MKLFDAIVLGGSLAGAAVGIELRKKGWRVLILERGQLPRNKVCGEFLSPTIWDLLERLNMTKRVLASQGSQIHTVTVAAPGKQEIRTRLPIVNQDHPYGYGVSRYTLDHVFITEANNQGCEVLERHNVRRIQKSVEGDYEVTASYASESNREKTFRAKLVVNAAGKLNLWQNGSHNRKKIGFKAHFTGIQIPLQVKLYFFKGGYLGLAPIEADKVNLCGIVKQAQLKRTGSNFDLLVAHAARDNASLKQLLNYAKRNTNWFSCGLPRGGVHEAGPKGTPWGHPGQTAAIPVGDGAWFLEPFMGQGMTMALASAVQLSELLGAPATCDLAELKEKYDRMLAKLYRERNWMGTTFNVLATNSFGSSLFVDCMRHLPALWTHSLRKVCAPMALSQTCVPQN